MNKKQLIVAWAMGILICISIFSTPKYYEHLDYGGGRHYSKKPYEKEFIHSIRKLEWDFTLEYSIPVLIIGVLFIYTLKDKKNEQ